MKNLMAILKSCPSSNTTQECNEFAKMLLSEHKTHQANVMRNLQQIIIEYSDLKPTKDARNEGAVNFADKVSENVTYIPYI